MDLEFSDEQNQLRATTRAICEQYHDEAALRGAESTSAGHPPGFWNALRDAGLSSISIPDRFGGAGLGLLDSVIVWEEFGRHLAGSPLFGSSVFAARAIDHFASERQRSDWLPSIASGSSVFCVAHLESGGGYDESGLQLTLDRGRLTGNKTMVPFANSATHILITAREAESGAFCLCAVPVDAAGVSMLRQSNIARTPMFHIELENVTVPDSAVLRDESRGWSDWMQIMSFGAAVLAAEATGAASRMLEITVAYAGTRVQFGKPIGAFQAPSHYLSELAVEIEGSRTLNYQAGWAHDNARSWQLLAAQAKLQACDTFRRTSAVGTQLHGGLGFTREAAPQLYFRRARFQQSMHWDPEFLERRIADLLLGNAA